MRSRSCGLKASMSLVVSFVARSCLRNASTPGAMDRATTRNPVWPIIWWSGRIASPCAFQWRSSVSMICGSVHWFEARNASASREICVVVVT